MLPLRLGVRLGALLPAEVTTRDLELMDKEGSAGRTGVELRASHSGMSGADLKMVATGRGCDGWIQSV